MEVELESLCSTNLEVWLSGRKRTLGKRVSVKSSVGSNPSTSAAGQPVAVLDMAHNHEIGEGSSPSPATIDNYLEASAAVVKYYLQSINT